MNDLQKLFLSELKGMYDAEKQLIKALPEMAEKAHSEGLRQALNRHLEQTKNHERLVEEVFETLGETPQRKSCKAMEGVIDDGQITCREFEKNTALDAAIATCSQKAEHLEITSYGSLCTWAKQLGNQRALELLKPILSDEKETDEVLSRLSEESLNLEAIQHDTEKRGETVSAFAKMATSGP